MELYKDHAAVLEKMYKADVSFAGPSSAAERAGRLHGVAAPAPEGNLRGWVHLHRARHHGAQHRGLRQNLRVHLVDRIRDDHRGGSAGGGEDRRADDLGRQTVGNHRPGIHKTSCFPFHRDRQTCPSTNISALTLGGPRIYTQVDGFLTFQEAGTDDTGADEGVIRQWDNDLANICRLVNTCVEEIAGLSSEQRV
eukprot:scaffold285_cov304-Pinguiococcus_pyrenoidosus.AAC.34